MGAAWHHERMPESTWDVPARIETERLVLRRYEPADAEQLGAVLGANIDHLKRYMAWIEYEPQTVEQRREWFLETHRQFDAGEEYILGMFDREGAFVGGTGFHSRHDPDRLEIGYWIDREHEGQGLVTEAAAALTRVALEYSRSPIVGICCVPSNVRSSAIPKRLGYVVQQTPGEECFDAGEQVASVMWWANRETLLTEPLASVPRPAIFDAAGTALEWPA